MTDNERKVTMAFRENSRNPGHVRVSVFIGRNPGARGHSGEIVIRTDEWDEIQGEIADTFEILPSLDRSSV